IGSGGGRWTVPAAEAPLTPEHIAILLTLDFMSPETMTQDGIIDSLADDYKNGLSNVKPPDRKTISSCLRFLRERHLIHRTHGERKGDTLTEQGKELVDKIQKKRETNH